MAHQKTHHHLGGVLIGMQIVLVGVLFLLDNLGFLDPWSAWDFWPSLLVLMGLVKLFQPADHPARILAVLIVALGVFIQLVILDLLAVSLSAIWPILVIVLGLHMLFASVYRHRIGGGRSKSGDSVHDFAVFGGSNTANTSADFRGGEVMAVFGGCDLDLSRAAMQADSVELDVKAIFGGVDIRVPEEWNVVIKGMGILGGHEDKTRHPMQEEGLPAKQLIITGYALFGGVDIKN